MRSKSVKQGCAPAILIMASNGAEDRLKGVLIYWDTQREGQRLAVRTPANHAAFLERLRHAPFHAQRTPRTASLPCRSRS